MKVSNQLYISKSDPGYDAVLGYCKTELVISNPDYSKKRMMGFSTRGIPPRLSLYQMNGDTLILPYGCLRKVLPLMHGVTVENDFRSKTSVEFNCTIPLFDYQEEAKRKMIEGYYGILKSPAGSGKTQIGLAIAASLGMKTLWVCHTLDLVRQSKERAEMYMDKNLLGTIVGGKVQIGRAITFATVQTLSSLDLLALKNEWDVIIVDECHHVAGTPTSITRYSKVLNNLAARHKYGLSATVHRADGLIAATYALIGDEVYTVPEEAVGDRIMQVSVFPRGTGVDPSREYMDVDGTTIYTRLITYLTKTHMRNQFIISDIIHEAKGDHSHLILSDRLDHLEELMHRLPPELRRYSSMVSGDMVTQKAKEERERAIQMMRTGEKKFLFATYALAKEGLDIPRLDRLYLTTPQKDYAVITQSIGRIARTFDGKGTPVCFDYVDNIKSLVKAYKRRCTTYRKAGCQFIEEVLE